jgi:hypothetical protein
MNADDAQFRQTLVAAMISSAQSMADHLPPSATLDFQATVAFLIELGLVERRADEGLAPPTELVELLHDHLAEEGFPTNPSKRAVCLTYTIVLQAVIALEGEGALLDGVRLPFRGSADWLPFIAHAAIVNVEVALPRVRACREN